MYCAPCEVPCTSVFLEVSISRQVEPPKVWLPNLVMINVYHLFICPNLPLLCSESVSSA